MRWRKLGKIYNPSGRHPKLSTHAANPLPVHLSGDVFRVFFNGRDESNRSSVGAFDFDLASLDVLADSGDLLACHGAENSYFSHGISLGNYYDLNGERFVLFMAWQIPEGAHWRGDIGRMTLVDNATLEVDPEPFLRIDGEFDKVSLSYPWVDVNQDQSMDMWYGSTITWDAGNDEMVHVINHARSQDGKNFTRSGLAVPYELNIAQAFSRPTVLSLDGCYHMWFSYRSGTGEKYRVGYAWSRDKVSWQLDLESSLCVSVGEPGDWDSEMTCYPFVFKHKDRVYMMYNGNGHGKTGVGLAVLEYDL